MTRGKLNPRPDARPEPRARPGPPDGPYLVVGLGRAGRAAAEALAALAGPAAVRAWTGYESPSERGARERLRALGVSISIGDEAAPLDSGPEPRCVVKSPGIAMSHPLLREAQGRGIPVVDELEIGWRLGSAPVVGVSGTNGKGTVTHLIADCLRAAGEETVLTGNRLVEPPYSALAEPPDGWVVCEVSSYQLETTTDFLPEVGVLTNLTHDHLHRHGDMATYGECKRRMLVRDDRCVDVAVLNADEEIGRRVAGEVLERGGRVLSFGAGSGADYQVRGTEWTLDYGDVDLETPDGPLTIRSRLPGPHNALNLAAALATVEALGAPRETALDALSAAAPVPGRLERIVEGQPFDAVVDFAHTPDAVAKTLMTASEVLRARGGGRLLAVVGVVGGSDPTKREPIGRIAVGLADIVVFTSGAPGAEPPEAIAEGLAAGARSSPGCRFEVEPGRRAAIGRIVELAEEGDLVLVLGRGSMPRMRVSREGEEIEFDDRDVLREELRALHSRARSAREGG